MRRLDQAPPHPMLLSDFGGWQKEQVLARWVKLSQRPPAGTKILPRALGLLSIEEYALLEQLVIREGRCLLDSWESIKAAQALRDRGWIACGLLEGQPYAAMAKSHLSRLPALMGKAVSVRSDLRLFSLQGMLHALLYLQGALAEQEALSLLYAHLETSPSDLPAEGPRDFLRSSYDWTLWEGQAFLLHPALLEPQRLLHEALPAVPASIETAQLMGAMQDALPEEQSLQQVLHETLIHDGFLPEEAEESALELRLLAKQGICGDGWKTILSRAGQETLSPALLRLLADLEHQTPKWNMSMQ